jgi:hypothetical protein
MKGYIIIFGQHTSAYWYCSGLRDYQKTENSCNLGADHDGPVNGDSMKKPKSANASRTFGERTPPR